MGQLRMFGTILWKLWFTIIMLITTIGFYPILLVTIVLLKNYSLTYQLYRLWAWILCLWIGVLPKIEGLDKIPDGPVIFISNHSSQLDIVVPYTLIAKHFAFLAKAELKKAPLFGINFRGMNITVDRSNSNSGADSLIECGQKLQNGISLLIFPEGTRSKLAPKMKGFKYGPFKLAIENGVPLVPLVFLDNYKLLEGGKGIVKSKAGPGKSRMIVLDPIIPTSYSNESTKSLKDKCFKIMQDEINKYL